MVEILNLYHKIPSEYRREFRSKISVLNFRKGDYLLMDGDVQKELFLIQSGVAAMLMEVGGKVKYFDFAYNNRFCVDIKSFTQRESSLYCIHCLQDCSVQSISSQDFMKLISLSHEIESAYRKLLERISAALLEKSLVMETKNMHQRFKWIMSKRPELFKIVPHKYIASYINIDETNFSKLYREYCIQNGLLFE